MREIQVLKVSHMRGGKIFALSLMISAIVIFILLLMLMLKVNLDFLGLIMLFVANGMVCFLAYKAYKPGFTSVTFMGDKIISKSGSETEELLINDIKGIWYSKNYHLPDMTFTRYTPDEKIPGGSLILIGDIDYFDGAEFISMNGMNVILKDCFWQGYTTVHYRKSLKPVLDYYYQQIASK